MAKKFSKILKIHPKDNIVVALRDLMKGDTIKLEDDEFKLFSNVARDTQNRCHVDGIGFEGFRHFTRSTWAIDPA